MLSHTRLSSILTVAVCPVPLDIVALGNLCRGRYRYMSDLEALEATATGHGPPNFQPATPLSVAAWEEALKAHPDQVFAHYILAGIKCGFHIGADRTALSLHPAPGNLVSVYQHPLLVEAHISEEARRGRLLGPLPEHLAIHCHASPIGLIPKPHHQGNGG